MSARAFICGCSGPALTPDEAGFVERASPWGLILFSRNVEDPDQIRALIGEFRSAVGWPAPVLVDQEGGRVQRLGPPHWRSYPPAARFGALHAIDEEAGVEAARLNARLIGQDLARLGMTIDCAPLLDLRLSETHAVIGDRAFHSDPRRVAALGRAACEGLLAAGIVPVVKHIPGHGRARADSHLELPLVEADADTLRAEDFAPFRQLSDMPLAMTAHIVYKAFDPDRPATLSADIIGEVIRGEIGFDGLLMSDDLCMGALTGTMRQRADALFAAGCDLALHCNGRLDEMAAVAEAAPLLAGRAARRAEAALAAIGEAAEIDEEEAWGRLSDLLRGQGS
jgi:beta-N-acetylhexosaminidase